MGLGFHLLIVEKELENRTMRGEVEVASLSMVLVIFPFAFHL